MLQRYNIVIVNTKNGHFRDVVVLAASTYSARSNSEQLLTKSYEKVACVYPYFWSNNI